MTVESAPRCAAGVCAPMPRGSHAGRWHSDGGTFVVSLDMELYWGVRDKRSLAEYRENLVGARVAIPRLLELFVEYQTHATWAIVGFLFFARRAELLKAAPLLVPAYDDGTLSPYPHLQTVGEDETSDPFHYARSLVEQIRVAPNQEIGTHTFSHYYCLEPGQDRDAFRADLEAAVCAARDAGVELRSIAFPRNQIAPAYLPVCAELGIRVFRGTEDSWLYRPRGGDAESAVRRALRLIDAYVNLSGYHAYPTVIDDTLGVTNVRASRFLRPYSRNLRRLEGLRRHRITAAMTHAARHGLTYHLWWHPHNFGRHFDENMATLRVVLAHYRRLADQYGMVSRTMQEQADTAALSAAAQPLQGDGVSYS